MKFSRRSFLQGVSVSIASYWGWENQSIFSPSKLNAYGATLNQSSGRKLALLVGINKYSAGTSLTGCTTDVELQKELLVHRFGFQPSDILTFTDENATRDNVIKTFTEHLGQATKDDVVVFHFSGYGRQVKVDSDNGDNDIVKSLIVYDSIEPKNNEVNDILLSTLIKLAENLNTKKYTVILDTNFTPPSTSIQQQISLRGYESKPEIKISQTELDFNKQFVNSSSSSIKFYQPQSKLSGLILSPVTDNIAVEINTSDFHAGLFTYTLTQSLWTNFSPRNNSYLQNQIASKISLYSHQAINVNSSVSKLNNTLNYNLSTLSNSQGIGVITKTLENKIVELKLLGLPLLSLFNYGINSLLTIKNDQNENAIVQINSIIGNLAKGTVVKGDFTKVKVGAIVQEFVRIISGKLGLNIGLDDNLKKIEKVDATGALSPVDVVSSVPTINNNFVDYILDKSNEDNHQGYSLFSPTGIALTYTNPTSEHEGVFSAVKRFEEFMYFDFDLACKLLHLTCNEYSSNLAISTSLEVNSQNSISKFTKYTSNETLNRNSPEYNDELINIPQNSYINIKLNNQDVKDIYTLVFEINPSNEVLIYNNPHLEYVKTGENQFITNSETDFKWFLNGNKGLGELIIVCAKSPFTKTIEMLNKNNASKLHNEQVILLKNSLDIVKSLLEDLHSVSNTNVSHNNEDYSLDINYWATFILAYQIT